MKLKYGHPLNVNIELVSNWGLQDVHLNSYLTIDILCFHLTHDYCSIDLKVRDRPNNMLHGFIYLL
jgi:hypothetical protein